MLPPSQWSIMVHCDVPVRLTVCGLPGALSLRVRVAVNVPAPLDENVTLIVQLAPIARLVPQLLLCENWFGLAPPKEMLLIRSGAVPELDSVTALVWLARRAIGPKARLVGDNAATGWTPVPVSVTCCGLVGSASVMSRLAARTPGAVGANVTLMEQLRPPPRLPPIGQFVVNAKSPPFVPLIAIEAIATEVAPTFARVTV